MGQKITAQSLSSTQIDRHIGDRVRRRRTLLGLTQEQLADALGISYQQVQKYETGANRVTAGRLYQIALCLQCDVAFFYDELGGFSRTDRDDDVALLNVSSRAVIELVRAFQSIESDSLRASLLNLARNIAAEPQAPSPSEDHDIPIAPTNGNGRQGEARNANGRNTTN